jgi:hypothetical protein
MTEILENTRMMRLNSPRLNKQPICLAIYGCSSLEKVSDFINAHPTFIDGNGLAFTAGQLAGQYAFEQVKLDRKGYDGRRLEKYLAFLSDSGAEFSFDEALSHAYELINNFTADFGRDEDGDATFRIKAQSFRLNRYDCSALWERVRQATILLSSVSQEASAEGEDDAGSREDSILDFRVVFNLIDPQNETFASLHQYVSIDQGCISVQNFVDYEFYEYPNFHDESQTMMVLMERIGASNRQECISHVRHFIQENGASIVTTVA